MMQPPLLLAFLQQLGWPEMMVIGVLALLIFGRRLPEVGRSLGRGIVEFKKGLKDTGDDIRQIDDTKPTPTRRTDEKESSERASQKDDISV